MNKTKISVQPYKGTRDFYPIDVLKREYLFNIWRQTALEFGYEEYDTPLLEDANLYRVKSGEELSSQLYNFTDKGGREVAIRPEMTPSLARMIAAKQTEISKPIRWFNIGKYYRYEKPQRGRTREFFQLNIDILGIDSVEAEVEILSFINSVMKKLKAPSSSWKIFVNNRVLMDYIFKEELNVSQDLIPKLSRAIDNYTKINGEEFPAYLKDVGLDSSQIEKLLIFLKFSEKDLVKYEQKSKGAKDVLEILKRSKELGIENIEFKPYIMRGLAYYTGTVIELFDIGGDQNPRALFGGGRYDDLLSIFGKEKLPAFGLGWGNVTTENFLETYNLYPNFKTKTKYFIALTSEDNLKNASILTQRLREKGIFVEQQLKLTSLGKQFQYADKKGIPFALIAEDDGSITFKDLKTREQKVISFEEIS